MTYIRLYTCLLALFVTESAFAYIGPGVGITTIVAVLGIFFGIVLLLFGVIWYPLKRLILKSKKNELEESVEDDEVM